MSRLNDLYRISYDKISVKLVPEISIYIKEKIANEFRKISQILKMLILSEIRWFYKEISKIKSG